VLAVSSGIAIGDTVRGVDVTRGAIAGEVALLQSLSSSSTACGAVTGTKVGLDVADFALPPSAGLPVDCEADGERDMGVAVDEIGSRSIDFRVLFAEAAVCWSDRIGVRSAAARYVAAAEMQVRCLDDHSAGAANLRSEQRKDILAWR
jgi:hypothetical protein